PFLAVWGKNDPFFLPRGAEAFRRDIPGALIHFLRHGPLRARDPRHGDRGDDPRLLRAVMRQLAATLAMPIFLIDPIDLLAGAPRRRTVVDEIAVERADVRDGLMTNTPKDTLNDVAAYTAARISSAARSPERTAPSIAPYEIVAVSVPAQ